MNQENPNPQESKSEIANTLTKSDPEVNRDDLPISLEDIKIAEKIFGLEFRDQDRNLFHVAVNGFLDDYKNSREIKIANNIPPPMYFNPHIPETEYSRSSFSPRYAQSRAYEVPGNLEELAFWPILDIANLIYLEKLTSTDLTKMFLDRIKRYDPLLKSVVRVTETYALEQANRVDDDMRKNKHRGVLHGIPYGIKDLFSHPDYPTTWGATPYKEQYIKDTATVIQRLEEKGAVMVAKLSMGALAWGDVWFGGKTKSPWNLERGSSGSSAGSAAATAAGMIPFAIGTETWGSIVSPSTRCGTTGLRPTFGRVSRHGAMALSWSMDKVGPIARTVEDCAVVFEAIRGVDGLDLTVVEKPFNYSFNEDLGEIRVGYLKEEFDKLEAHKELNDMALNQMRSLNIDLKEVTLPDINAERLAFILTAEAATAFDELTLSGRVDELVRQGEDSWPNLFRQARMIPAVEYIKANRIRYLLMQQMSEIFKEVDVYLAPPTGRNPLITNLTGNPAVVVPIGFKDNKLPASITFIGGLYNEAQTLRVAKAYQDSTNFHNLVPPI